MLQRTCPSSRSRNPLEGGAVEEVLAGVDLVADVDAVLLGGVEERPPAPGQLLEGGLDQAGGALRPRVDEGPGQGAGEGRPSRSSPMRSDACSAMRTCSVAHAAAPWVAVHLGRCEAVEKLVVGRMHGDELALEVGGELGHLDAVGLGDALELVALSCEEAACFRSISWPAQVGTCTPM